MEVIISDHWAEKLAQVLQNRYVPQHWSFREAVQMQMIYNHMKNLLMRFRAFG